MSTSSATHITATTSSQRNSLHPAARSTPLGGREVAIEPSSPQRIPPPPPPPRPRPRPQPKKESAQNRVYIQLPIKADSADGVDMDGQRLAKYEYEKKLGVLPEILPSSPPPIPETASNIRNKTLKRIAVLLALTTVAMLCVPGLWLFISILAGILLLGILIVALYNYCKLSFQQAVTVMIAEKTGISPKLLEQAVNETQHELQRAQQVLPIFFPPPGASKNCSAHADEQCSPLPLSHRSCHRRVVPETPGTSSFKILSSPIPLVHAFNNQGFDPSTIDRSRFCMALGKALQANNVSARALASLTKVHGENEPITQQMLSDADEIAEQTLAACGHVTHPPELLSIAKFGGFLFPPLIEGVCDGDL